MTRFEWDENKNRENLKKHRIDFETAQFVFDDPQHISEVTQIVAGEERWTTVGYIDNIALIAVGHTYRDEPPNETYRLITARRATKKERKQYEEALR
jgi:uncharacterized DUF497 family protein